MFLLNTSKLARPSTSVWRVNYPIKLVSHPDSCDAPARRTVRIQKGAVRPPLAILALLTVARRCVVIVRPAGHLHSRERHLETDAGKRGLGLALGRRASRARARPAALRELPAPSRGFAWAASSSGGFVLTDPSPLFTRLALWPIPAAAKFPS